MNSRKNNSPPRCRLVDTIGMAAEFAAVTKRCGVWNIAVGRVTRPRVTAALNAGFYPVARPRHPKPKPNHIVGRESLRESGVMGARAPLM